jgi:hypothetical protein
VIYPHVIVPVFADQTKNLKNVAGLDFSMKTNYLTTYPACYTNLTLFGCGRKKCPLNRKGECKMFQRHGKYPVYVTKDEKVLTDKVIMTFDFEQLIEIANVFFYVNWVLSHIPKWLGGIRLSEYKKAVHKSIHDAAYNACLSLEEKRRFEAEGGNNG